MFIVDPTTSKVVKVLTTGFADRWYSATNSDATGKHLVHLSNGNLMVSDEFARPQKLATGLIDVDW